MKKDILKNDLSLKDRLECSYNVETDSNNNKLFLSQT